MKKIDELINVLEKRGVMIDNGLSTNEIKELEEIYEVRFPKIWCDVFSEILPVSEGFYNWRDMNSDNISMIKKKISAPYQYIIDNIQEVNWDINWGNEPENELARKKIVYKRLNSAPNIIPIYYHRYLPTIDLKEIPVLSIVGLDIICYGRNIFDYFQVEFGTKTQDSIDFDSITKVPFWMDDIY